MPTKKQVSNPISRLSQDMNAVTKLNGSVKGKSTLLLAYVSVMVIYIVTVTAKVMPIAECN